MFDLKDFGIVGNDIGDALQRAIDTACIWNGGTILIPRGQWVSSRTWNFGEHCKGITLQGESVSNTSITNNASDVFTGDLLDSTITGLSITARGGHIFALRDVARLHVQRVELIQNNPQKSIWFMDAAANPAAECLESVFERFSFIVSADHPTPAWHHIGGNCTMNTWRNGRCTNSGAYFFLLENPDATSFIYDNRWQQICFEVASGGGIKVLGGYNTVIEQCVSYDTPTTAKDLFFIGKHPSGSYSMFTSIKGSGRRGGTLAAGTFDIHSADAKFSLLESNGSVPLSTYKVCVDNIGKFTSTLLNDQSASTGGLNVYGDDYRRWRPKVDASGALSVTPLP